MWLKILNQGPADQNASSLLDNTRLSGAARIKTLKVTLYRTSKPYPDVVKLPTWWNLVKVLRVLVLYTLYLSRYLIFPLLLYDLVVFLQVWVPLLLKITEGVINITLDHFDPSIGAISETAQILH